MNNEVDFEYCETEHQLADLFTKPLDAQKFKYFVDKIMYDPSSDPDYVMYCHFNDE